MIPQINLFNDVPEDGEDRPKDKRLPVKDTLQTKITPLTSAGIKLKLGSASQSSAIKKPEVTKKLPVSSVFGGDDDSDEEEMPAFASMRMKNIGRKTPTSSGPNSFGKTKNGFCDQKKLFEKMAKDCSD